MEFTKTQSSPLQDQRLDNLDCSDLLGAHAAFLPTYDAVRHSELVNAYCNKVGSETPPPP